MIDALQTQSTTNEKNTQSSTMMDRKYLTFCGIISLQNYQNSHSPPDCLSLYFFPRILVFLWIPFPRISRLALQVNLMMQSVWVPTRQSQLCWSPQSMRFALRSHQANSCEQAHSYDALLGILGLMQTQQDIVMLQGLFDKLY